MLVFIIVIVKLIVIFLLPCFENVHGNELFVLGVSVAAILHLLSAALALPHRLLNQVNSIILGAKFLGFDTAHVGVEEALAFASLGHQNIPNVLPKH